MFIRTLDLIEPIIDLFIDFREIRKSKTNVASCCMQNNMSYIRRLMPKKLFCGDCLNFMWFDDLMFYIPSSAFFDDKIIVYEQSVIFKSEINKQSNNQNIQTNKRKIGFDFFIYKKT